MSTLELHWDARTSYTLWSWSAGDKHYAASISTRLSTRIYAAALGPRGGLLMSDVALKIARGQNAVAALEREARLYTQELRTLQGTVVPRCMGYFRGRAEGTEIGCMVMEHCRELRVSDPFEVNRMRMQAACRLHQAGVMHNRLAEMPQHFIEMGNSVRIVGFSMATLHRCENGTPCLLQERPGEVPAGCPELFYLEKAVGIMSDGGGGKTFPVLASVKRYISL